jgi:hypothetical protein
MRRVLIRALALALAAGATWSVLPVAAEAQTAPAAVILRLVSQSAWNGPRQPLALTFAATNTSATPYADLSVELIIWTPARSRTVYELSLHADATSTLFANSFPQPGTLEPGQTRTFSIHQPLDLLTARNETVIYPLRVELHSVDVPIGILRAPLIFLSEQPKVPLNLTWSWVLSEPLQYGPDGTFGPGPIEADVAPGGRLDAMVGALTQLKRARADVVVSSVLVDELRRMSGGYRIQDAIGPPRVVAKGTAGAADAVRVLAGLQRVASLPGVELISTPFGDPSIPALVGANLLPDLHTLMDKGDAQAKEALHATPRSDVARPLFSQLDGGTLAALARSGVRTVLLDPGYVPTPPGLPRSPLPVARFAAGNRTVVGVLPDTGVASIASAYQADPTLDAHAVLGELAAIWLEFPGTAGRGAAILFPERTSLPPALFSGLASLVVGSPWLRTVPASGLESTVGPAARQAVAPQGYPGFTLDYVRALLEAKARLAAFRAMGEGAKAIAVGLEDALLLSESSSFVTNAVGGERFIGTAMRRIRGVYDSITVAGSNPVTLTSRNGILPITIDNRAGFPVRVIVQFVADRRLVFVNGLSQKVLLPAASRTITFPVRAQTTGRFPIKIELLTPSPASGSARDTIAETDVIVRSTAYNRVALFLTIGAALFLAIWWGRRFLPRPRQ